MHDFTRGIISSDNSSSPKCHQRINTVVSSSTQKKLRRTEHLVQPLSISATEPNLQTPSKTFRSTRTCKNLFLPKIIDAQDISLQTPSKGLLKRDSLLKRKLALKVIQRKIETKPINKKPKHARANNIRMNTIPESPVVVSELDAPKDQQRSKASELILKELYVLLVPLEKTNLCSEYQKALQNKLSTSSFSKESMLLVQQDNSSARNDDMILENGFYRQCRVMLHKLPNHVYRNASPLKSSSFIEIKDDHNITNSFIPYITSSPYVSPVLSDSTKRELHTYSETTSFNGIIINTSRLSRSFIKNNASKESSSSSVDKYNGTYTISNPNTTNITFRKSRPSRYSGQVKTDISKCSPLPYPILSFEESGLNLLNCSNSTRHVLQSTPQNSPKSALKSNSKKTIANGIVRRVTFSNTSVIIVDDSDLSSPEKSFKTLTPTNFASDDSDEENSDVSQIKKYKTAGHTPFLNKKSNTSRSVSKVKKVPNFSALHQAMFNKMPNLEEYVQQKRERAQLLLSGHKPRMRSSSSSKNTSKTPKRLDYSSDISVKEKRSNTPVSKPKSKILNGLTRFGFKSDTIGNLSKKEERGAAANRTKPLKSTSENMKMEIKGVRTNRRFELLMKMRLNKK